MANKIILLFNPLVTHFFQKRPKVLKIWKYIQNNPEFTFQIGQDVDKSVALFNIYRINNVFNNQELLKSSVYLKQIIKKNLPTVNELFDQILNNPNNKLLIENILKEINNFDFIETLKPISACAGTLLLGSYRSAILVLYPYLKKKNVQIASSLEEMIALMDIKGEKTKLFGCLKSWYVNYKEEGFTKELSLIIGKK